MVRKEGGFPWRVAAGVAATGALIAAVIALAPTASATTIKFTPVADSCVNANAASANYGTATRLGVDRSPIERTFVKFSVTGLSGPVSSAKLRMHTQNVTGAESPNGGAVTALTNTGWSETGVTYSNQPAIDGASLGSFGAVATDSWYEVDVTALVTGNGTFSVAVTAPGNDGADFDSRESGANGPQLVVTTTG